MYTVMVIGVGSFGVRHLESLLTITEPLKIFVVDSHPEALAKVEKLSEANPIHRVCCVESLESVAAQDKIDVAIISTTAGVRATFARQLFQMFTVRNIVFEKVLFQRVDEYSEIETLLKNKNVSAWVNCPRRLYPGYVYLREELKKEAQVVFQLSGGEWGIGCNGIHFIDLFAYLSGDSKLELDGSHLDSEVFAAKRKGCMEFTGTITAKSSNGSLLVLGAKRNSTAPHVISITSHDYQIVICEWLRKMFVAKRENNWQLIEEPFQIPFQSQLTGNVVERILRDGQCDLTSYAESMELHLPIVKLLKDHASVALSTELEFCPIT